MKPKVCGNPVTLFDPFQITKTTLLFILLSSNIFAQDLSLAELDLINQEISILKEFARVRVLEQTETKEEAEARWSREESERNDIALNKAEIKNGKYWINGAWYYKNAPQKPRNIEDLKDSDNDGYDDYTEYKHGTDWNDPKRFPIIRYGNNRKTF